MATELVNLRKCCFFVLSGITNSMGESLADEICRYFKMGSVILLIDTVDEPLQMTRKNIENINTELKVICFNVGNWEKTHDESIFQEIFAAALKQNNVNEINFELAFIIHNEGIEATKKLIEPQDLSTWLQYLDLRLYFTVKLNQQFIRHPSLNGVKKLVVNISSSLPVQPLTFNSLLCSCKKSRDMYFRSMAAQENCNNIVALNYFPGIFSSHSSEIDGNNNIIKLENILPKSRKEKYVKFGKHQPKQATLKLINILQNISFISGHDVDYYDTYNL